MNNNFDILNLTSHNYGFLIINKDFNPLREKLSDINKELSQRRYVGNVILNTLTSTCNKNKQYSKVYFNGNEIQLSTLIPLKTIDKKIQYLVNDYFTKNNYLLEHSLFSIT